MKRKTRNAVSGHERDAALQQGRAGEDGKDGEREDGERISEGSCGGENGAESEIISIKMILLNCSAKLERTI